MPSGGVRGCGWVPFGAESGLRDVPSDGRHHGRTDDHTTKVCFVDIHPLIVRKTFSRIESIAT
jgi:hypothetical protein